VASGTAIKLSGVEASCRVRPEALGAPQRIEAAGLHDDLQAVLPVLCRQHAPMATIVTDDDRADATRAPASSRVAVRPVPPPRNRDAGLTTEIPTTTGTGRLTRRPVAFRAQRPTASRAHSDRLSRNTPLGQAAASARVRRLSATGGDPR